MQTEKLVSSPHFQSLQDEIDWHLTEANLGFTRAQHRLGLLFLRSAFGPDELNQAYKWLFIAVALGSEAAKEDFIEVNARLDHDQVNEAYQLAEDWFDERFEGDPEGDETKWSPELMKWRFALDLVH